MAGRQEWLAWAAALTVGEGERAEVGREVPVARPAMLPRVGRNLGGFVSRVSEAGLAAALRDYDLADLVGRPAQEVTAAIVERLGRPRKHDGR